MSEDLATQWLAKARESVEGEFYVTHFESAGQRHSVVLRITSTTIYLMKIEDDETYRAVKAQLIADGKVVEQEFIDRLREEQRKM